MSLRKLPFMGDEKKEELGQFMMKYFDPAAGSTSQNPPNSLTFEELGRTLDTLKVNPTETKKLMWGALISSLKDFDNLDLPIKMSESIENAFLESRCGKETLYLKGRKVALLRKLISGDDVKASKQYLNMNRDELCLTLTEMNRMVESKTNRAIQRCSSLLTKITPDKLDMPEEALENLKTDVTLFAKAVESWDNVATWYAEDVQPVCKLKHEEEQCLSKMDTFHTTANHVTNLANTCVATINKAEKSNLRKRVGDKDVKTSYYDRVRSWF